MTTTDPTGRPALWAEDLITLRRAITTLIDHPRPGSVRDLDQLRAALTDHLAGTCGHHGRCAAVSLAEDVLRSAQPDLLAGSTGTDSDPELTADMAAAVAATYDDIEQDADPFPAVDLTAYQHPQYPKEWRFGPDRGLWTGGHPVIAMAGGDEDGNLVTFKGYLGVTRDELPELIGWLTAVHEATDPNRKDA